MVADMVAFVASQFTTSTWDVGAQELCSVVLILMPGGAWFVVQLPLPLNYLNPELRSA